MVKALSKLLKSAKSAKRSISLLDVKPVLLSMVNGSKSVMVVLDVGGGAFSADVFFGDVKLRRCCVGTAACDNNVV